jgi:hypothetical protein
VAVGAAVAGWPAVRLGAARLSTDPEAGLTGTGPNTHEFEFAILKSGSGGCEHEAAGTPFDVPATIAQLLRYSIAAAMPCWP